MYIVHFCFLSVFRPRRSRSAAAYSRQTFPWTICRSVRTCVGRPVQCIVEKRRLVLRWVTVSGVQSPVPENLSQHVTSHPGQLSLVIPPWVGVMSTSQRVVMPCGWGVKAGMVREWVASKTVWSPCYHGPYLSAWAMGSSHNRALYKCPITLLL